jgi:molybdopterin molybdotransferase
MLSVAEAQQLVLKQARPLPPVMVPLNASALGRVLAEDVVSDLDMPPYDKAMMDGFAVRSADLPDGRGLLSVIDEVMAGQTPRNPVGPGQAIRIMTGAPIPDGADAVVMVERTRLEGNRVEIEDKPPEPGLNILRRGREMRRGDKVLESGAELRPQEFGLLATVGRAQVSVFPPTRVAILSTGDELVEAGEAPGPGQIRNGNSPMLLAQVIRAGGLSQYLGIARDRPDSLLQLIAVGLQAQVLVLSGGVSAGELDLVPGILQELGVQAHFHKVAMKPGKPVFFGTRDETLVFGLPGNPVSALVCFELFVRPALRVMQGQPVAVPALLEARSIEDFTHRSDRPTYHPARIESDSGTWLVQKLPWFGSPDLRALTRANALLVLPAGEHHYQAGQMLPVMLTDR